MPKFLSRDRVRGVLPTRVVAGAARAGALLACVLVMTATLAGSATAGAATVVPSATPVALTFPDMGLPSNLSLNGSGSAVTVQIPVPQGLQAEALSGTIEVPTDVGSGYISVTSGTQQLAVVNTPPVGSNQPTVNLLVSLAGAKQVDQRIPLTLQYRQTSGARFCNSTQSFVLVNPQVAFGGSAVAPTTVANFFPPILQRLIIYVPPTPTSSEQSAALSLAAAIAERYRPQAVQLSVVSWPASDPLPVAPSLTQFARAVVIRQSGSTGLSVVNDGLQGTVLVISGSAETLPEQTQLLTRLLPLAQGQSASVLEGSSGATLSSSQATFSQLGIGGSTTLSGQQTIALGLDEASFGGLVTSLDVHLQAEYTPPGPNEKATAMATVGSTVLGSWTLNGSGQLSQEFTIPHPAISRSTPLALVVSYWPVGGCNNGGRVMTFTVDPRSWVSATMESGGAGGFPALPTAMLPSFQVALADNTAVELDSAVQVVAGMQQMSSVLLDPNVVALSTATGSKLPVLVVGSSEVLRAHFSPPLASLSTTTLEAEFHEPMSADVSLPIAALQVFDQSSHQRTVVMVSTSGSWDMVTHLLGSLGDSQSQWSSLTGDVLATTPTGAIVNLTVRAGGAGATEYAVPSSTPPIVLIGVLGGCALALVILMVTFLLVRRARHSQPKPEG